MECKYCQHTLDEGSTICPSCGKDNAEKVIEETVAVEETVTEETAPAEETAPVEESPAAEEPSAEIKPGIHFTPGKLALLIGAVVVLTAVVVALILQGMGVNFGSGEEIENTEPTDIIGSETVAETVPATVPADGNPDDETCKGTYTVSDDEVIAAADTVVATMGDAQLTNAQLQIYYWMSVQQFLSTYSSSAYYTYGLDYTLPLDTQLCAPMDNTMTWQQYFLSVALNNWQTYQALANESVAAGFELDEETLTYLETMPDSLATDAGLQGFESAEDYLAYNVGKGSSIEDYVDYMEVYYQGLMYFDSEAQKLTPTEDEIEAFFTEHEAEYAESGITRDTKTVDIRHILVLPEGATIDTIYTETFSDEAWEVGRTNAQAILDAWKAGEATEESFAELANEHSADPGSNTNGGLYEDVYTGDMVEAFDAWCFDESRQYGDADVVQTELGFHVMYYSGEEILWPAYAESDLLTERTTEMVAAVAEKYPLDVDYSAIKLGFVDMSV